MNRWDQTTLGDLIALQRGHDLPSQERTAGDVPIIGSFGITGSHNVAKYSGPGVAIGRSGAAVGKATFVDHDYWPLNTCLFVRDFKGNDPRWVYWLLDTMDFMAFNSGSAQPSLNRNFLRNIPVLAPPIGEQEAIAEVLGALEDKIVANTKLVEVADELAASLTRKGLDVSQPVALSTIADIVMGSSPSGSSFNEIGEGTVFYQGVRDFGVRFPSNRVWTTAPVRLAVPGDTLLSVRAPVGRVNLATEGTCIGRGVASIRSSTGRPFTLFHLLKGSEEAWAPFEAEGTVFGSINKSQLASLLVPSLRAGQEERLEGQLAPIERAIASALGENANLAATRDALLPQLMSGKLRVKDAEKALENAGV
jgi:type I restriction enzyme S subunit